MNSRSINTKKSSLLYYTEMYIDSHGMLFVLLVCGESFFVEPMVDGNLGNVVCIQSPDFRK